MNTQRKDSGGARDRSNSNDRTSDTETPNADMQPEDAGTADSGASGEKAGGKTGEQGEGDKARAAMKQTSKTNAETGGNR